MYFLFTHETSVYKFSAHADLYTRRYAEIETEILPYRGIFLYVAIFSRFCSFKIYFVFENQMLVKYEFAAKFCPGWVFSINIWTLIFLQMAKSWFFAKKHFLPKKAKIADFGHFFTFLLKLNKSFVNQIRVDLHSFGLFRG